MKRNWMIIIVIVLLAGLAVYQNSFAKAKGQETALPTQAGPKTGLLAPDFSLDSMDGKTYRVGGNRDKPLLLNFWASWCGPCEVEAPDLQKMYDKYKDQLDIYAVNVTKNDVMADVKDTVKQFNLSFPILLDKEGTVTDQYQIQVLPTSYLIDKNGTVVEVIHLLEPSELERKIKTLIKKD